MPRNVLFGYYGSWSTYRDGNGKCDVDDIDPTFFTHLIYTFVGLEPSGQVKLLDPWNDIDLNSIARFVNLKERNPTLKVLVAMGGWNEGSVTYSAVVASPALRCTLVNSVVDFVRKYKFDGFDLDWEYPGMRGGSPEDKENYVNLLRELRSEFDKYGLILTTAVGTTQKHISQAYDIPSISKYVNYIMLMTYDMHGVWDKVTGQNAPLDVSSKESRKFSDCNINAIVTNWINQGAPASKLVLGIPLYGHSYTLTSSDNNQPGSAFSGPGKAGKYSKEAGSIMYSEICENLKDGGWTTNWDDEQKVPFAYKGDQWISYDNPRSVKCKAEFAKSKGLAGVMVWSVEQDDFRGKNGEGRFPLITAIKSVQKQQ